MKNKANTGKTFKSRLIFQYHKPWNPIHMLNQESWFLINLILNDKIKKINFKNLSK